MVLIKKKTMIWKNLLFDLVAKLQQLYEMYCANEKISDSKMMKYFLHENFEKSICFTPACWIHRNPVVFHVHGNPVVVHVHKVNPVDYAIVSVIGVGLRDAEITISFAKIIRRKLKAQETGTTVPISAENLSGVMKTQFT